jgi:hypothetical protein
MASEQYGEDIEGYREATVEALESLESDDSEDGEGSSAKGESAE